MSTRSGASRGEEVAQKTCAIGAAELPQREDRTTEVDQERGARSEVTLRLEIRSAVVSLERVNGGRSVSNRGGLHV